MKFKGDIIITDPCYIIREQPKTIRRTSDDDWDKCDYGENMEVLGINTYFTENTIYGDWSCTTFELKDESKDKPTEDLHDEDMKDEPLGKFCADAGLVSVFLLDEVLKYNPDFDYHIRKEWTTTLIKNFDGDVEPEIVDGDLHLRGRGNVNFVTSQTGL